MMLKIKYLKLLFIILLFSNNALFAQNHEFVKLKEEKTGKRLELYAVNTSSTSYELFLQIETEDFRRSSLRPIIKTVPPKSKTILTTIIQLANTEGVYDATFIVNEGNHDITIDKDKQSLANKINSELNKDQLVVFTETNCKLCNDTKMLLGKNKRQFIEYNISTDPSSYTLLTQYLMAKKVNSKTNMPILYIKDSLYTSIKSKEHVEDILKKHF